MAQNTQVAKMQYLADGTDIFQIVGQGGNVTCSINEKGGVQYLPALITANGAVNPRLPGFFIITKGSIASLTLAAPVSGTDDGLEIEISSNTAFAHVITTVGLLLTSSAAVNSITFPAFAGATVYLTAFQGKWILCTGGLGTYVAA